MFESQQELDDLLDKQWTIKMEIDNRGAIPAGNPLYRKLLNDINNGGFKFTARELLHAIGCKTAKLPENRSDQALAAALLYTYILDLKVKFLCFKNIIDSDRDLKTPRSQEVGIGITCLIAKRYFGIGWDQLEPIVKVGKRFDYRSPVEVSSNGGVHEGNAIFEAKGTMNRSTQKRQIKNGLQKKSALDGNTPSCDIKLIISTFIGIQGNQEPVILMADPDHNIFGNGSEVFYKYRHYAKVFQYIGLPEIAAQYYRNSSNIRKGKTAKDIYIKEKPPLITLNVNNIPFEGQWFTSWVPAASKRYKHLINKEKKVMDWLSPPKKIKSFQGIIKEHYDKLLLRDVMGIRLLEDFQTRYFERTQDGTRVSVFPDGTILALKI
jgi:hypothetical protein